MTSAGERPILGILPPAGGGLTSLARTGQVSRLVGGYFPAYLKRFKHLYYFSYHRELLSDFTTDPTILDGVSVVPRPVKVPFRFHAFRMPFTARSEMRRCVVLRVLQATGAIPAMIAWKAYKIPFVTTYGYRYHAVAAVEGRRISSLFLRLLEPIALRRAAATIVTTPELAEYVGRFITAEKVNLIPNGVDTTLFAPDTSARDETSATRSILFVGRLTRQKNLARLLQATSLVSERHGIRLRIIGDGPLRTELDRTCAQLGLNCGFESTVPHESLPAWLNRADIFVLPSLVEGHPKALLEAMSCGLPCVVSDCEGNRMLITHEETGLVFDPTDVREMAAQIDRALSDRTLAAALGRAARIVVVGQFDLGHLLDRETILLRDVAERGAG